MQLLLLLVEATPLVVDWALDTVDDAHERVDQTVPEVMNVLPVLQWDLITD